MKDIRIQKVLADQGLCSRRAAEQIISEGRVKLNGHPVSLGDKMDTAKDILSVDGQRVMIARKTEKYYYALYKPRGFITTASDERGRKTVMELMQDVPARVYPIGRLDKDSEGLLLFTNDGEFANLLTHPSHGASKLYRVTVRPHATEEQIIALTDGVTLDDGTKTLPAVIRVITDEPERTVLEMTIREGKNRQIRRMCEAVGLGVIRLRRTAVGAVKLGMLQPGEKRELTPTEVTALRTAASRGKVTSEIAKNTEENARRAAAERSHGVRAPKGRAGAYAGARDNARGTGGAGGTGSARGTGGAGTGGTYGGARTAYTGKSPVGNGGSTGADAPKSGGYAKTDSKPGNYTKTDSKAGGYAKSGAKPGAKPGRTAKSFNASGYASGKPSDESGSYGKSGAHTKSSTYGAPAKPGAPAKSGAYGAPAKPGASGSPSKFSGSGASNKFSKPGAPGKFNKSGAAGATSAPGRKSSAYGTHKPSPGGSAGGRGGKRGGGHK